MVILVCSSSLQIFGLLFHLHLKYTPLEGDTPKVSYTTSDLKSRISGRRVVVSSLSVMLHYVYIWSRCDTSCPKSYILNRNLSAVNILYTGGQGQDKCTKYSHLEVWVCSNSTILLHQPEEGFLLWDGVNYIIRP